MKILLLLLLMTVQVRADIIQDEFISGGRRFRSEGLSQFKYPFVDVNSHNLLLVTHASRYWDKNAVTWKGIVPLINIFRAKKAPIKYLMSVHERVMQRDDLNYYPEGIIAPHFHPFQGDSHRIIFKGRNVVVSGGNFTICACNAARSIIALSESSETLRIYFPLDGMYEGEKGAFRSMDSISGRYKNADFIQYLKNEFFNEDTLPCKEPSLFALDRKFNYKIYRHGKLLAHLGDGETEVELYFDKSQKIIQDLTRSF